MRLKTFLITTSALTALSCSTRAQSPRQPVTMPVLKQDRVIRTNPTPRVNKNAGKNDHIKIKPQDINNKLADNRLSAESSLSQYLQTPGGLLYKYIERGTPGQPSKAGDIATIHVEYRLGDSLIFTTTHLNTDGEPVTERLKSPQYRGDVNEGLLLMQPGDKIEFRFLADSLAYHAKTQLPSYVKSGDFASWTITMYELKTMEAFNAQQEEQKKEQASIDDKIITDYLKKNNLKAVRSPAGVYIVFHEEGFGESPVKGNKVTVNYTGRLLNGKVFDSNTDPQFNHVQPLSFTLLAGQVIKGWDEGIAMMRKNSKATLYIPSTLAYGNKSQGPDIPANSILVFDIEILDY